jgi:hypothetical protein
MNNPVQQLNLVTWIWESTPTTIKIILYGLLAWALIQILIDFIAKHSLLGRTKAKIRRLATKNLNEIQDCQRILEVTSKPDEKKKENESDQDSNQEIAKALHLARSLEFNAPNLDCILKTISDVSASENTIGNSNAVDTSSYPILHQRIKSLEATIETNKALVDQLIDNVSMKKNGCDNDFQDISRKTQAIVGNVLMLLSRSTLNNRSFVDQERLLLLAKRTLTRFIEYSARSEVSAFELCSKLSAYNPLYRVLSFSVLVLFAMVWFVKYLFDTDGILVAFREYWYYKPRRRSNDMRRFLHLAWHCSVYIPILAITFVASVVLGIGKEGLFFLCLASSAVSLEICVSVILDKVHHLQDLTRQTTRAIRQYEGTDAGLGIRWIKYFQKRHVQERTGVAKAALVTVFSIFLFSIVLGIEVLTLKKHSLESEIVKLSLDPEDQALDPKVVHLIIERIYNEDFLLIVAGICSFVLFFISVYKLWVQTRYVLEDTDAMDRFKTPEEAESEYLAGVRRHDSTEYLNDNVD